VAIGLSIRFAGATAEQYDAVDTQLRVEANPPEGLIFHAAGPIRTGWGILDFWESREHFDRFFESRVGPAMAELGDRAPQGPPDIREFPIHKHINP
jgi:hypothetical protein